VAHVLITGASGLLGRHTVAAWLPAVERTLVDSRTHDLLTSGVFGQLIRELRPDVVLHLAWTASSTPGYRTSTANAGWRSASHEAARTCLDLGIQFVATGTVVDDGPGADAYTDAKAALRADLGDEIDAGHVTWLRPHYVFDPDEPSPAVLRAAGAARVAGRPVELATPEATHDFVHAADVGRAVVAAVVHGLDGIVDIGSGRLRTVSALVEAGGARWTATGPSTHNRHGGARADTALLRTTGWLPSDTERYFGHD
jgi:nucleoside-diphosphate-sugar epimerase